MSHEIVSTEVHEEFKLSAIQRLERLGASVAEVRGLRALPYPEERVTFRLTSVVRVKLLLTPVIVNVKVPLEALLAAFRVRVEEAAAAGLGLKLAVTPLGNPLTLRETVAANPSLRVMFTV